MHPALTQAEMKHCHTLHGWILWCGQLHQRLHKRGIGPLLCWARFQPLTDLDNNRSNSCAESKIHAKAGASRATTCSNTQARPPLWVGTKKQNKPNPSQASSLYQETWDKQTSTRCESCKMCFWMNATSLQNSSKVQWPANIIEHPICCVTHLHHP